APAPVMPPTGHSRSLLRFLLSVSPIRPPPTSTLFPCTTLFRSAFEERRHKGVTDTAGECALDVGGEILGGRCAESAGNRTLQTRSEEHTSELQSRENLVCRLLLEKKNSRRIRRAPERSQPIHRI